MHAGATYAALGLEVVDQNVVVAGLAELAWRLSECVYSFLQLLDFFVTHLAIEGKPKLALPKLMHTFKVLLVEVGITQKPIGDVFLVGPQVDAPSVQLAD